MIVLDTNLTLNTFGIIPRVYTTDFLDVVFLNELRGTKIEFTQAPTITNGVMYFQINATFKEGQSFDVEIKRGNLIIHRGKAFAVNIQNYYNDVNNYRVIK